MKTIIKYFLISGIVLASSTGYAGPTRAEIQAANADTMSRFASSLRGGFVALLGHGPALQADVGVTQESANVTRLGWCIKVPGMDPTNVGGCPLGGSGGANYFLLNTSSADAKKMLQQTLSKNISCGSVIDYAKKTVSEQIPLDGSEFYLNYTSAYNSKTEQNRMYSVKRRALLGINPFIKGVSLNTPLIQLDNFNFGAEENAIAYLWDGVAGNGSSNIFASDLLVTVQTYEKSPFDVNLLSNIFFREELEAAILEHNLPFGIGDLQLTTNLPSSIGGEQLMASDHFNDHITLYHPEHWGLMGWTVSEHHYFEPISRTLFQGNGQIESYENAPGLQLPEYPGENLIAVPDKGNPNIFFVFNSNGMHLQTRSILFSHPIYKFSYDVDYKLLSIEDVNGKLTQFVYNSSNKISKIIAPYGQETNVTTDASHLLTVTDSLNQTYEMTYDTQDLLTSFKSISGVIAEFIYNDKGEFTEERKNNGLVQKILTSIVGGTRVSELVLNWGAKTKSVIEYLSTGGERTSRTNNLGEVVYYEDHGSNSEGTSYGSYQNQDAFVANKVSSPLWGPDVQVLDTTQSITAATNDSSTIVETSYVTTLLTSGNPLDIVSMQTKQYHSGITNPSRLLLSQSAGIITTQAATDIGTVSTYYNQKGQVTRIEPSSSYPRDFTYNLNGQLTKIQKGNISETYAYDSFGFLASIVNSKNQTTSFTRDSQGKVLTKTLPNQDQIHFEYTSAGEIKKITTPSGQIHNFQMSLGDYVSQYVNPESKNVNFTYDSDKRLTQVTKPSNKTINYNYSATSGYIDSISTNDGDYVFSAYDPQARPHTITSPDNIKIDLSYQGGQIQQQKWYDTDGSVLATLSYKYQFERMRISQILLNGNVVANMTYNPDHGRLQTINDASYSYSEGNAAFGYHDTVDVNISGLTVTNDSQDIANGDTPIQMTSANLITDPENQLTIVMKRSFDNFGQATEFTQTTRNLYTGVYNNYYSLIPEYDDNNRLIQITRNRKSYFNNQLVETTDYQNQYLYPPNSNNNMKEFNQSATSGTAKRTIASHGNDDALISLRGSMNRDYQYTADGDLKSMTNCFGTNLYDYDVFGNLKKATLANGTVVEYKVDAMNRRVKKIVDGVTQEYYIWYDQIHLAAILDANKVPKITYLYGPESNSPSLIIKDGVTYKILHDPGLGSVRFVVNPITKQIEQEIEYDEFGNMMMNTNPYFQPVMYAGGLYDADTKLIRFGARDYDPTIGRWTTKDPAGFRGGMNPYVYVEGNPMSRIDPNGLWSVGVGGYLGLGGGVTFGQNPDNKWFVDIQLGAGVGAGAFYNKHGTSPDWGNSNGVNGGPALAVGGFFDAGLNFGPLGAGYSRNAGQTFTGLNTPTEGYNSGGFYGGLSPTMKLGAGISTGAQFCVRP